MFSEENLAWILSAKFIDIPQDNDVKAPNTDNINIFPTYSQEMVNNIVLHFNNEVIFLNLLISWPKDIGYLTNFIQELLKNINKDPDRLENASIFILKTLVSYYIACKQEKQPTFYKVIMSSLNLITTLQNDEKKQVLFLHIIKHHMKVMPELNSFNIEQIQIYFNLVNNISDRMYSYIPDFVKYSLQGRPNIINDNALRLFDILNNLFDNRPNFSIPNKSATDIVLILSNIIYSIEPNSLRLFENLCPELTTFYACEIFRSITANIVDKISKYQDDVEFVEDKFIYIEKIHSEIGKYDPKREKSFDESLYSALVIPQEPEILIPAFLKEGLKVYTSIVANNLHLFNVFMTNFDAYELTLEKNHKIIGLILYIISQANELDPPFRIKMKKFFSRDILFDPKFQIFKHKNDWLNTARDEYIKHMITHNLEFHRLLSKLMHFPEIFIETLSRLSFHPEALMNDEKVVDRITKSLVVFYNNGDTEIFNNLIYNILMLFSNNEVAYYLFNNKDFVLTILTLLIGYKLEDQIVEIFKLYLKDKGEINKHMFFECVSELLDKNLVDFKDQNIINFATLLVRLSIEFLRFFKNERENIIKLYKVFTRLFTSLQNNLAGQQFYIQILVFIRSTGSIAQIKTHSSSTLTAIAKKIFTDKKQLMLPLASLMAQEPVYTLDTPIVIRCNQAVKIMFDVVGEESLEYIKMLVSHSQRNRNAAVITKLDLAIIQAIKNNKINAEIGLSVLIKILIERSSTPSVYSILNLFATSNSDEFMKYGNALISLIQDENRTPITYIPVDGSHSIQYVKQNFNQGFTFITWISLDDTAEQSVPIILKATDEYNHSFKLFVTDKLPRVSWTQNSRIGVEAAKSKLSTQTWYFYSISYLITEKGIMMSINVNGFFIPLVEVNTANAYSFYLHKFAGVLYNAFFPFIAIENFIYFQSCSFMFILLHLTLLSIKMFLILFFFVKYTIFLIGG